MYELVVRAETPAVQGKPCFPLSQKHNFKDLKFGAIKHNYADSQQKDETLDLGFVRPAHSYLFQDLGAINHLQKHKFPEWRKLSADGRVSSQ